MPTHDRTIKAKAFSIKLWLFSYPYVLGAQKNRLIETVGKYPLHHGTYEMTKFEVAKSDTFRDAFTRKCITRPLTLPKVTKMLPSTLYIILPMHMQSLKLLRPMVKEKMNLQEMH